MKDKKQQKNGTVDNGLWSVEEDNMLPEYVNTHGKGHWNRVSKQAGLKRSGKSCRLRWMNYLSPSVKRERFTEDEDDLIIRLHNLLGNRWALIAGRVPGRTDNQVKNYWNTHLSKKVVSKNITSKLNSGCTDHNHQSTGAAEDQVISSDFSSNTTCRTTKSLSAVPIEKGDEEEEDAHGVRKRTRAGSRQAKNTSEGGQREMDHGSCFMQYLDDYTLHFVLNNNNLRGKNNASPSPSSSPAV